ncbi:MAG: efflux RND transporter permease subunit, partial [Acidobacteriota bacterium]
MNKMAWLYAWVLVLSGLAIATTLTLEWSPELENPIVEIQAYWSAASPTAMAAVGSRLEASMLGLGSVRDISSRSSRGSWSARVSLDPSSEMALQQAMISDRLTAIRDSLPPGLTFSLEPVAVDRLDSKVLMTLQLAVDKVADGQSKERVELIASRLRSIRGIADVKVRGLRTPELRASLKDDRAASCDDCASVVRSLLRSALQPRIFGAFRPERHQQLALRRAIDRSSELRRLGLPAQNPMAPERLSDLADLRWNDAPAKSLSRVDGRAMVTLVIVRAPGSDLLNVANRVHRTLEDWGEGETNGLEIHVADDRSERIREELRELASIGGSGFLLIFLVLWIMLRSWRAAALSLFSVLVS